MPPRNRRILRPLVLITFLVAVIVRASEARQQFAEAKKLLEKGLLENARAATQKGLEADPRSAAGYNLLGIIDTERKDHAGG